MQLSKTESYGKIMRDAIYFFLFLSFPVPISGASQVVLVVKNPPANAGDIRDTGSILGSERSPGERNGNHSSILAWKIPGTDEPGGVQSRGSQSQT